MAIEKVKDFFKQYGMDSQIKEFEVSSATVDLAASALGCEPERIAKTLSFMVNGQAALVVAAGDAKVDNKKFKEYFKTKAKMLSPDEAIDRVGHAIGGVCPFAIKNDVSVYLDISLKRFETIYPACGSSNSAIELTIKQLEQYSSYSEWIDACKGWNDCT
ncbi:YbaK/EbsC family protein [Paenibacillus sp. FSL R7-0333]|uniref:YbaK/EbsC family protein n=1 Tax=Paenibacillus sp. FSL R7-0333 TaxID=1926587 RepID=UPI00096CEDBE|nr:EBSC protein [Paenibacillus sp. FSL R7-0333]